jgi:hypothetical protein
MEDIQGFQENVQQDLRHGFQQTVDEAHDGEPCFTVTYLDADCGRIRSESFDDAAAADRFANRCISGEDGWAVVDAIPAKERRAAA